MILNIRSRTATRTDATSLLVIPVQEGSTFQLPQGWSSSDCMAQAGVAAIGLTRYSSVERPLQPSQK
jgi:hypothetical protein